MDEGGSMPFRLYIVPVVDTGSTLADARRLTYFNGL
jgi:hypothetical protein